MDFKQHSKTTTVGVTAPKPQTANLIVGEVNGGYLEEAGYQLADEGTTKIPIYKETPKFSYQGESNFTKTLATKSTEVVHGNSLKTLDQRGGISFTQKDGTFLKKWDYF